jgi:hypothetical protein
MITLVAAVELFVAARSPVLTRPEGWDWRLSRRAAPSEATGCAVLCFGDSMVKQGVQPWILQARLGVPAYNLALSGGAPPASYFLLRRALEHGARPALVVLDAHPETVAKSPGAQAFPHQWSELAGPREALELGWATGDADFCAAVLLSRLLPSAKDRFGIRANIATALRGEPTAVREAGAMLRRNWARNRGAQLNPKSPPDVADVVAPPGTSRHFAAWRCDPANAHFLRAFLRLTADRGIPVVWLLPPVMPGLQTLLDREGAESDYVQFLRGLQREFPGLSVVDARHAGFAVSHFTNAVHLDRQGSHRLSAGLAEDLGHRLGDPSPKASPEWADLRIVDGRPADSSLEDVFQSRMALDADRAASRR